MPLSFSSLGEARIYLELGQRRALYFVSMFEDEKYQKVGIVKVSLPSVRTVGCVTLMDWSEVHGMSDGYLMHFGEIL